MGNIQKIRKIFHAAIYVRLSKRMAMLRMQAKRKATAYPIRNPLSEIF